MPAAGETRGAAGRVIAVDLSPVMCRAARRNAAGIPGAAVEVLEGDALELALPEASADCVVSSFGLKTFSPDQVRILARQVSRVLRPGGVFSFLEISVPRTQWLRGLYMFYLGRVIPLIGKALMGNPDNYRMLGVYTSCFGGCEQATAAFTEAGLRHRQTSFFFGCATGIMGSKPA